MVKLSLEKFKQLAEKNDFIVVSTYCEGNVCRFIECKTPLYQRTFLVYLPSKFEMIIKSQESKRFNLVKSKEPSSLHVNYITGIKGNMHNNIATISANIVCANVGTEILCYVIGNEEDKPILLKKGNDIEMIENDIDNIMREVRRLEEKKTKEYESYEILPDEKMKNYDIGDGLNIEFQDEDGKPIGELDEIIDTPVELDAVPYLKKKNEELHAKKTSSKPKKIRKDNPKDVAIQSDTESELSSGEDEDLSEEIFEDKMEDINIDDINIDDRLSDFDEEFSDEELSEDTISIEGEKFQFINEILNDLPDDITESKVKLGHVYYISEISDFFKEVENIEADIADFYTQIGINEDNMYDKEVIELKKMMEELLDGIDKKLEHLQHVETTYKSEIIKLTDLYRKTSELKEKISKNPEKFADSLPKVESSFYKVRSNIFDITVDMLRIKDEKTELILDTKYVINLLLDRVN